MEAPMISSRNESLWNIGTTVSVLSGVPNTLYAVSMLLIVRLVPFAVVYGIGKFLSRS
jgi:hypothetical protein